MRVQTRDKQQVVWLDRIIIRLPLISRYAELRGAEFVFSWLHRISGGLIIGFVAFHLFTLQALKNPLVYNTKMGIFNQPLLAVLEWVLAIPIIYHALNGGRIILFESYGFRQDHRLMNWVLGAGLIYCGLLGIAMLTGSLTAAPFPFWGPVAAAALILAYLGGNKIWRTAHSPFWKLQRTSGLFLLIMVPAHLFFMHMNPLIAKDAEVVLARLQNPFIRIIDLALAAVALYHGAYGLISIANDYVGNRIQRRVVAISVIVMTVFLALLALRLLIL